MLFILLSYSYLLSYPYLSAGCFITLFFMEIYKGFCSVLWGKASMVRINLPNNDYYEELSEFSPDGNKIVVSSITDPYYYSDSSIHMITIGKVLKIILLLLKQIDSL